MSARLRPLRDDEFDAWHAAAKAGYAASIEHDGGVPGPLAQQKAERDLAQLLPDRRIPDGHAVFVVEDERSAAVGRLWVAERDVESGRALFVYEVAIEPAARCRGHGRRALEFAEQEARRRGLDRIALTVFGGNDGARRLYTDLGYRETAVFMEKGL